MQKRHNFFFVLSYVSLVLRLVQPMYYIPIEMVRANESCLNEREMSGTGILFASASVNPNKVEVIYVFFNSHCPMSLSVQ